MQGKEGIWGREQLLLTGKKQLTGCIVLLGGIVTRPRVFFQQRSAREREKDQNRA